MPAAAVIPAPIAYIRFAAVEKLVVELWAWPEGPLLRQRVLSMPAVPLFRGRCSGRAFPPAWRCLAGGPSGPPAGTAAGRLP